MDHPCCVHAVPPHGYEVDIEINADRTIVGVVVRVWGTGEELGRKACRYQLPAGASEHRIVVPARDAGAEGQLL